MFCATVLLHSKLSERQAITDGSGRLVTEAVNAGKSSQQFAACIYLFILHLFIEIHCLVNALLKVGAEKPGLVDRGVIIQCPQGQQGIKSLAHTHTSSDLRKDTSTSKHSSTKSAFTMSTLSSGIELCQERTNPLSQCYLLQWNKEYTQPCVINNLWIFWRMHIHCWAPLILALNCRIRKTSTRKWTASSSGSVESQEGNGANICHHIAQASVRKPFHQEGNSESYKLKCPHNIWHATFWPLFLVEALECNV